MRSLFVLSVLGITVLGVTATLPSFAHAKPAAWQGNWRSAWGGRPGDWRGGWGGGYRGWWGGRSWYLGGAGYYPYAGFYYPNYGLYYPPYAYSPYAYYPPTDYSTGAASYSIPESGSGSAQAEPPHPTGGTAVPPPDAGLMRLRVPDEFAEVSFNGQSVSSVGTTRDYVTPPIQAGETYRYTITVAWGQGEQQTTLQKTVEVARGQTRAVDFTAVPKGN